MVIDAHLDFINAGAEVIVTSTFTARRNRLIQNDCEKYFEKINIKAVELAQKARDISKKEVLIAGGLPNQKQTYTADLGKDLNTIKKNLVGYGHASKKQIIAMIKRFFPCMDYNIRRIITAPNFSIISDMGVKEDKAREQILATAEKGYKEREQKNKNIPEWSRERREKSKQKRRWA